jgi:hypothetical protein
MLDVVVEGGPEPLLVVRRHERVEEDERAVLHEGVGRDVALPALAVLEVLRAPVRVRSGPPPEVRLDLPDLHGARR